jgi:signal transduction histidine kinase
MKPIENDLLEYPRSQLRGQMPIERSQHDVSEICQAAINDVSSAHPDCPFTLTASGNLLGNFDGMRLHQVLSNLLNNAAQYRGKAHPISITMDGKADELVIEVQNFGPVIPADSLRAVFDPLVQLPVVEQQPGRPATSMGLGLFIASEITRAHGGSISVSSDESSGTIFRVQLPHYPFAAIDATETPA